MTIAPAIALIAAAAWLRFRDPVAFRAAVADHRANYRAFNRDIDKATGHQPR